MCTARTRWTVAILLLLGSCVGCGSPRVLRMAEECSHFQAAYTPTPGDDMAGPLRELSQRLTTWGVSITDLPAGAPGFGYANLVERSITLNPSLSVNGRFEVLAHEAGHLFQPPGLQDAATAQLFAELVGVGVQRHYGSTTAERVAAQYLCAYKWTFASEKHLRADIDYAVRALTGQVDMPRWAGQ